MPFLAEIATVKTQTHLHVKGILGSLIFWNEKGFSPTWKFLNIPKKRVNINVGQLEIPRRKVLIRAVSTLEPTKGLVYNQNGHVGYNESEKGQKGFMDSEIAVDSSTSEEGEIRSSSEDSKDLDERERLRRIRISKSNKGNAPWNKGRKHSAETIQRIRERTRLAMQDPKVRMKLVKLGHAQSQETRTKIGVGVRMGWQRRREKLRLQETCYFEWQNLMAEASRKGYGGEEELQWDSYETLDGELKEEWLESVEQRKKMPRPNGSKRAPKSAEQRRKISEAISAKWADPEYRERVCSALSKYHATPVGTGNKRPRKKPSGGTQSTTRSPQKKKVCDTESSFEKFQSRFKRSNAPRYKDPLASSKLEMIKSIRAQRASAETQKTEAIERARLLISEAEKAAKALEVAAIKSPIARAALIETRKLIAEAIQSIESIESDKSISVDKEPLFGTEQDPKQADQTEVNGIHCLETSEDTEFDFSKFSLQDLLSDDEEEEILTSSNGSGYGASHFSLEGSAKQSDPINHRVQPNGNLVSEEKKHPLNGTRIQHLEDETCSKSNTITKNWVRGRLVEVAEGA